VDLHEEEGVSAAQVVMTKLHAGGKFDSKSYKVSGGLHGVGVSCVNALSEKLELEIWREKPATPGSRSTPAACPKAPLAKAGKAGRKTGTRITFKPDTTIMEATEFNYDTLANRLRELAFLNKGLKITLTDERVDPEKNAEFQYTGGIAEFIKHLNKRQEVLHDKPIHFEAERELPNNGGTLTMEVALQYNDGYSENVLSFANNINTVDGGTHLSGFRTALTRTINAFGQQAGTVQGREGKPHRRRRARGADRGGQRQGAAAAVRRPDQGQAEQRHRGFMTQFVNEKLGEYFDKNSTVGRDRRQGDRRGPRARGGPQGARPDAAQGRARIRRHAAQAGRLPGARSGALRAVPGRGRIGRRHRQAGARPPLPGHPAAQGKNSQRREGALRQDAGPRGNPHADHGARHRHRQGRFRFHQGALRQDHHHDRCRRGRLAHPHAAADLLLPPHERADPAQPVFIAQPPLFPHQEGQEREVHQGRKGAHQGDHARAPPKT
jgi:DNA gyrase subunit B